MPHLKPIGDNIMFDMKEVGRKIRAVRKKLGLTQTNFGKQLAGGGVTFNTVARWEHGERTITLENLFKIKEAFNVDWNDLLP